MARRRRRPTRRPSRSRPKARTYTARCADCGAELQMPLPPPDGVELTCVDCLNRETPTRT